MLILLKENSLSSDDSSSISNVSSSHILSGVLEFALGGMPRRNKHNVAVVFYGSYSNVVIKINNEL